MPTYEYKCGKCSHKFDVFQSMKDEPVKKCPKCGGKVERLIGAGAGIIFKGPGFYATDYRKGRKPEDKKEGGAKLPDACKKCDTDNCKMKE